MLLKNIQSSYLKEIKSLECTCNDCFNDVYRKYITKLNLFMIESIGFIPDKLIKIKNKRISSTSKKIEIIVSEIKRIEYYNNKFILDDSHHNSSDIHYCAHCGVLHMFYKILGDKYFCKPCFTLLFYKCNHCKDYISLNLGSYFRTNKNKKICISCKKAYYESCNACSTISLKDSFHIVVKKRDQNGNKITSTICNKCYESKLRPCNICGDLVFVRKQNRCIKCFEREFGFFDYTYKPINIIFLTSSKEGKIDNKNSLFMGYELEIESHISLIQSSDTMGHLIRDKIGRDKVYTVHDGSITKSLSHPAVGLEVVSYPFTWEEYKEKGKHRIDDLSLFIRSKQWRSNKDSCGFHVHSTKAAWGTFQIYKLIQFLYQDRNFDFNVFIAEREPNTYCFMEIDDFDNAILVAKDKKNRQPNHYGWLNLNNKSGYSGTTIEFRMFAGSTEPLNIHKNIEFVKSMFEFTKSHGKNKMFKLYFMEFVDNHQKEYPCLHEFLKLYN